MKRPLKQDLSYTVSTAFHTFPFPETSPSFYSRLDRLGKTYHEERRQIMLVRGEGLTTIYNRFHNPSENSDDIASLRELHLQVDRSVALSYGWADLDLEHGYHETKQGLRFTISEAARREMLDRLLALNHHRYAEEVAHGLHDKKKAGKGKGVVGPKKPAVVGQAALTGLFRETHTQ